MSDPIKDLENFDHQGHSMNPLTPAEIRRRGDRMRRRNNGVLALGAAAAVAVIATSGVLVNNAVTDRGAEPGPAGTTSDSPSEDPSPSEIPRPPTTIPDGFPLDAGIEGAELTDTAGMANLDYCGRTPLADLKPKEVRTAGMYGGETSITRTLYLFESPKSALEAHNTILDAAWDCSFDASGTADADVEIQKSVASWPGDTIVKDYGAGAATEPTVEVVNVVNNGSALLVTSTFGAWSTDHQAGVDLTRQVLAPVMEAMEDFGASTPAEDPANDSGEQGSDTGQSPPTGDIADGFPLAAGWPADSEVEPGEPGLVGPNRTLTPVAFRACGEAWNEPAYAERMRADWSNVEDYRSRQLTTYEDADAAVAAVADLVAEQQACPVDPVRDDGYVTEREVREVAAGGEGWAILERDTLDGAESPFGATTVVVRLGRAVLVLQGSGHAGYPSGDGQAQVDEMVGQASEVIDAMCAYTRAGC